MPERLEDEDGEVWGGDRRLSRPDTSLPDWEMPDGAYRPVPIVWFAGALFLQIIVQSLVTALVMGIFGGPAAVSFVCSAIATALVWRNCWSRGMASAGQVWQVLTGAMLLSTLGLVALALAPFHW